ncbi:TraM recognition domain-containing protein [Microbulbifer epialgicus]|uniref:TraM recognition domain-containing protein n=1 Tax=Microbulbifer epialgicus TaxID=393907 RepID=A0ABV4NTR8_9GAMM
MSVQYRAPEQHQGIKREFAYRDTRSISDVIRQELPKWDLSLGAVVLLTAGPFYSPLISCISIPAIIGLALWSGSSRYNRSLPMKLPASLGKQTDYNNPVPGSSNQYYPASGTILLGNLRRGKTELWLTGKDLLTHMLLIGTTGSGKTETLVSLSACTAFCMGGGTIYVDAKAAPKLLYQFGTLNRMFCREDDSRVISYITGNRARKERYWERLSNTTNPFAQGTANTAEQTLIGLLPKAGGDNQYFLDRAIAILRSLLPALVELRDKGVLNIYPSLIGEYIAIDKFMSLAKNHIEVNGIHYPNVSLSDKSLKIIRGFLKGLPGFNPDLSPDKQAEEVHRQFGFAEGYFARTLASLAGVYGHIYETELGEADFVDIVLNKRILIVLVPAMEQASEERAALGKIVLSSIRSAMARGLGGKSEGDYEDVIEALPIDLRIPTIIIVDEYAEVAVEGFAVTATQGRGLGVSVVFAGQDLAGFIRASQEEADMIFGNTTQKVLMKLEDPETTWKRFKELGGTMKVAEGGGWDQNIDGLSPYKANLSASIREADRINLLDLKEQSEGQAHIFERANIHRAQMFHWGLSEKKWIRNFRINRMLKIKSPDPDTIDILQNIVRRNINLERNLNDDCEETIPHIPSLDRLAGINSFASKSKWPWRFLATLEDSDSDQANISNSQIPSKKLDTKKTTLSSSIDKLDEAVPNDNGIVSPAIDKASVPPNTSHEHITSKSEDFDGMNVDVLINGSSSTQSNPLENKQPEPGKVISSESSKGINEISRLENKIQKSLAKAENHWIFISATNHDGLSKSQMIYNNMVEINTLAGQSSTEAKISAVESIDGVTDAVVYPSGDIVSKAEDVEELWEALDKLH